MKMTLSTIQPIGKKPMTAPRTRAANGKTRRHSEQNSCYHCSDGSAISAARWVLTHRSRSGPATWRPGSLR
jgi:hypothetical protein